MTGTSKMYASTFTKCLDQLFQTQIMPLGGDSMEFMQNLNKGGFFEILQQIQSFKKYIGILII